MREKQTAYDKKQYMAKYYREHKEKMQAQRRAWRERQRSKKTFESPLAYFSYLQQQRKEQGNG